MRQFVPEHRGGDTPAAPHRASHGLDQGDRRGVGNQHGQSEERQRAEYHAAHLAHNRQQDFSHQSPDQTGAAQMSAVLIDLPDQSQHIIGKLMLHRAIAVGLNQNVRHHVDGDQDACRTARDFENPHGALLFGKHIARIHQQRIPENRHVAQNAENKIVQNRPEMFARKDDQGEHQQRQHPKDDGRQLLVPADLFRVACAAVILRFRRIRGFYLVLRFLRHGSSLLSRLPAPCAGGFFPGLRRFFRLVPAPEAVMQRRDPVAHGAERGGTSLPHAAPKPSHTAGYALTAPTAVGFPAVF